MLTNNFNTEKYLPWDLSNYFNILRYRIFTMHWTPFIKYSKVHILPKLHKQYSIIIL